MSDNNDLLSIQSDKPARADAIRNRRAILNAAETLFTQEGIAAVTMSAIAREAGIGKGTLYRNFKDKADLCHALLDEDMRDFQQATLLRMRNSENPAATLRWFLEHAARYVVDHHALLREVANQGGIDIIAHPAHLWWRQTVRGLLARIITDADDVDYIADVLYVLLDVQTIRFQQHTQGYDLDRIVQGLHTTMHRLTGLSSC